MQAPVFRGNGTTGLLGQRSSISLRIASAHRTASEIVATVAAAAKKKKTSVLDDVSCTDKPKKTKKDRNTNKALSKKYNVSERDLRLAAEVEIAAEKAPEQVT